MLFKLMLLHRKHIPSLEYKWTSRYIRVCLIAKCIMNSLVIWMGINQITTVSDDDILKTCHYIELCTSCNCDCIWISHVAYFIITDHIISDTCL